MGLGEKEILGFEISKNGRDANGVISGQNSEGRSAFVSLRCDKSAIIGFGCDGQDRD